ncbi:diguanylate cyclase (GGDEF) domain-containing protein/hemerythrin-like metal-binding domain protein [Nitrosomonas aestuarii]|uniref:diguanylate cyclase n=1 Tax=Nitrosomonas aestuarii TaxID=52441 RepID=A0A1I4AFB9_9PROT|nr:bacteriohemerythrin [Nitrosomonas aestuarii]SFK55155.1 diguanylate cyclase (GGDEF) domain-containing protein/hemerythrin-like metal-binding domain protein [Nitrosomonas aestuarii]
MPQNKFEVFPWNKNFEIGIEVIDEQHKMLISLLNELASTITRDNPIEINHVFSELAKYAEYHFQMEEAIWVDYFGDDSWLSSHQLSHSFFLPKVIELKEQETSKSQTEIIECIILFLIRWLAFHIMDNDKRMALCIENIHKGMPLEEAKIAADKKMNGSIRILIETVMEMYDSLSTRTLALIRESHARQKIEKKLHKTNKQLRKANLRLESLSITDQLTDLYNRRHFNSIFMRELKRARREKLPLALIFIDIDFFKQINDNYGHSEGDRILIRISQQLKIICQRPGDYAFRLGGEEFGVISSNLDIHGTAEFAEIIRKEIEGLHIPNKYSSVSPYLTVTVGSVTRIPDEIDTIDSYMSAADKHLYEAKESGRNRIITTK